MKFGRAIEQEPESLPLAPFIDIVFLTLVFFMVTSVYGALETEVDIALPTADTGVPSDRMQGEVYINLLPDGQVVVNDRAMNMDELGQLLFRIAEHFPGGAVIIRGDRSAQLGSVIEILDACRRADIAQISFATLPPEELSVAGESTP